MLRAGPLINVMDKAVRAASRPLVHDFGEIQQLQTSRKGPRSFLNEAYRRTERILTDELRRARPEYGILKTEEDGTNGKAERWILSPIDGLLNFVHGIPHFSISVAVERNGDLVAGLIYEPIRDELFWAERGAGAFLNRNRLRVSQRTTLADALLATGSLNGAGLNGSQRLASAGISGIRELGAASLDLAYVAAGRLEGFWDVETPPQVLAAGIVMVREAGGLVSDFDGRDSVLNEKTVVAASGQLHDQIRRLLSSGFASDGTRAHRSRS